MLSKGVLLQQDIRSSHSCFVATSKVRKLGFEKLPRTPHSPDLASSDEKLKKTVTTWLLD